MKKLKNIIRTNLNTKNLRDEESKKINEFSFLPTEKIFPTSK